jgi:hypothetical protein
MPKFGADIDRRSDPTVFSRDARPGLGPSGRRRKEQGEDEDDRHTSRSEDTSHRGLL